MKQAPTDNSINESLPEGAAGNERRARIEIKPLALPLEVPEIPGLIGKSARMRQLTAEIYRKAKYDYDVLIEGGTGSGKTLIASAIHWASQRSSKQMLSVNSSLFTQELLESQLFGHEKGAFTGATDRKIGLLEAADGGILFFDEIGEMSLALQAKILTALEEKRFRRLGGREEIKSDVRIIYATNCNLEKMVEQRTFREDLYYRIKRLHIRVPGLDERREDIPLLVRASLDDFSLKHECDSIGVEERAMAMLMERAWPGNVRELINAAIELAISLNGERSTITADDVDAVLGRNAGVLSIGERDDDAKTIIVPPYLIGEGIAHYLDRILLFIYNTLIKEFNSPKRAADILKTDPNALNKRLKRAYQRLESVASVARLLYGGVEGILRVKKAKGSGGDEQDLPM